MKYFVALLLLLAMGCAGLKKVPTSELKFRHHQIVQYLNSERGGFQIKWGNPMWGGMGNEREDRIKEKEEIERELLRRYQAGDGNALLSEFGSRPPLIDYPDFPLPNP